MNRQASASQKGKQKNILITGLPTGFINGLLGSGGGSYLVPQLTRKLKLEQQIAHATSLIIIMPTTLLSLAVYLFKQPLPLTMLLYTIAGGCIGGLVGAKLLTKVPGLWLALIFGCILLISGCRMAWAGFFGG
ncbi:MAG: sulfite exporter TauE/SafE family protein [Clostridiales bacterium]